MRPPRLFGSSTSVRPLPSLVGPPKPTTHKSKKNRFGKPVPLKNLPNSVSLRHATTSDACQIGARERTDERVTALGQTCIGHGCARNVDLGWRQSIALLNAVHDAQGAALWACARNPFRADQGGEPSEDQAATNRRESVRMHGMVPSDP
jgi:hypothetical protein